MARVPVHTHSVQPIDLELSMNLREVSQCLAPTRFFSWLKASHKCPHLLSVVKHPFQYVGTWFPWFQGHPLISGALPLESGAGFA